MKKEFIIMSKSVVSDHKTINDKWAKSLFVDGKMVKTKSYQKWCSMLSRCSENGREQRKNPNYIGCSVGKNFNDFQYFVEWYQNQIGYDFSDYQLDKDILVKGNKLYDENNCCLVPHAINSFFTDRGNDRGEYQLGVTLGKNGKFISKISINGKNKHLGTYDTEDQAHDAYTTAKKIETMRWITRLENKEFLVELKVIDALKNHQF